MTTPAPRASAGVSVPVPVPVPEQSTTTASAPGRTRALSRYVSAPLRAGTSNRKILSYDATTCEGDAPAQVPLLLLPLSPLSLSAPSASSGRLESTAQGRGARSTLRLQKRLSTASPGAPVADARVSARTAIDPTRIHMSSSAARADRAVITG